MFRLLKYFCFFCTIALWISCGNVKEDVSDKKIFYMNINSKLSSLDPAFARNQANMWMCSQIFDGLVHLDKNLEVQASIAKSWKISEDGLSYTFLLRNDVFFHDSEEKLTSEDVLFSFTRICDPKTASPGQWIFNENVAGVKAFQAGQSKTISGFQAINDSTFQIQLARNFPAFLGLLAMPYAFIIPKKIVQKSEGNFKSHPIGSGAFKFFYWEKEKNLILHKNENYFQRNSPKLDAIVVYFISSKLSEFVALKQGKLDFINSPIPAINQEIFKNNSKLKDSYAKNFYLLSSPQLNTEYLGFMMNESKMAKNHPLRNKKVRLALNYAIDRKALVKYLLQNKGKAANAGFIPYGMPGFSEKKVHGYSFDLQKAQKILAEAGFPSGKNMPQITLNSNPEYKHIAEFVQKSWTKLGVDVKVNFLDKSSLREQIYQSKITFWRGSWIADYADGENYLSLFYSKNFAPNGPNTTNYKNAKFDELYEKALTTTDDSLRFSIYQEMENIMLQDAPIIPLYYDQVVRVVNKRVSGFYSHPMNWLDLKTVDIK